MTRELRRIGAGLVILGMVLTASEIQADQAGGTPFYVACTASEQVDPGSAAQICAEFIAVAREEPGLLIQPEQTAPLTAGPGLEIRVERATDIGLEVTPTRVDSRGTRMSQPSVGVRISDARMTEDLRRDFFRSLLADSQK